MCFFGQVTDGDLKLNPAGRMVREVWEALPRRFPHINLDAFVVMPNHLHGIILIEEEQPRQGLGKIVGGFKSISTNRYIAGVRQYGWPRFAGRLWQDNYFEHVIRNDAALLQIREYIANNPFQWDSDPERAMYGAEG